MAEQDNRELVKALGEIAKALGGGQQTSGIITQLNQLVLATNAQANIIKTVFPNFVPVPATAVSAGTPYQVAVGGGFFYICIGVNSWMRVAIAVW